MLGISSIMLLFDAGAYIFRGNIDSFSIVMTRICNFFVFFLQLILLVYGVKLTYILIESNGNHPSRKIKYTAYILSAFAAGLFVVNLFTKTMYYFDENNYYHRNAGWYFYTAITVAIMIFTLGLVWKYWKHMNQGLLAGIICYVVLPLVSVLVQLFV